MMDNFDLRKYLAENKLLKEEFSKPQEDSDLENLKSRYNPSTPEDLRDLEAIAQKQDPKLWMLGTPEFDSTQIQLGDYIKFPVESKPTLVWYADDKKVKADYDSYEYSTFNRSLLNKMNREQSQDTSLNEAEGTDLYYDAGQMISQVGLFTRKNADKMDADGSGNLGRWYDTPEEREELIKISEAYPAYLAKVKAAFDELMNDPMYRVAVGDVGGKYRDRGPGETLEKAYYRSKRY